MPDRLFFRVCFCAAALVGGHQVRIPVVALDGLLEVVVVPAAGVRLIAKHHPGPLPVAHGGRAGVRQDRVATRWRR